MSSCQAFWYTDDGRFVAELPHATLPTGSASRLAHKRMGSARTASLSLRTPIAMRLDCRVRCIAPLSAAATRFGVGSRDVALATPGPNEAQVLEHADAGRTNTHRHRSSSSHSLLNDSQRSQPVVAISTTR